MDYKKSEIETTNIVSSNVEKLGYSDKYKIADLHYAIDVFWKQNSNAIITKIELISF